MISTLDSNRLLNLKARHGIAINSGGSTSIYLSSKKLERELQEKLSSYFSCTMDLNIYVEKILNKINDVDLCLTILDWVRSNKSEVVLKETKKIKSFMATMRRSAIKTEESEENDEEQLVDVDF